MIGKIKKQHLDPALLLELQTGSASGDLSDALINYQRKDELIEKKQLNPNIFDAIALNLDDIEKKFNNYRLISAVIKETDLDTSFLTQIDMLKTKVQALEQKDSVTTEDVGNLVEQYIQAKNYFLTIKNETMQELKTDYIDSINSNLTVINNQLVSMSTSIETIDNTIANDVRRKSNPIEKKDLANDVTASIDNSASTILTIQNLISNSMNKVTGKVGGIVRTNYNNELVSSALLQTIYACSTDEEVLTAKTNLVDGFYDITNKKQYIIKLAKWNNNYFRDKTKEAIADGGVGTEYIRATLTVDQIKNLTDTCKATIVDNILTITNTATTKTTAVFGFYGKKIKLYGDVASTGFSLQLTIDNNKIESSVYDGSTLYSNICIFDISGLSEGAHNIAITIDAGKSISIKSYVDIDSTYSSILIANDIPSNDIFKNVMYDKLDYFINYTGTYTNLKSSDLIAKTAFDSIYDIVEKINENPDLQDKILLNTLNNRSYYISLQGTIYNLNLLDALNTMQATIKSLSDRITTLEGAHTT